MGIKSVRIKNLLSFEDFSIDDFKDINCIVGRNNSGKTNLLKIIDYFYSKLNDEQNVPPQLLSNYSATGSITLVFDTTKIKHVVSSKKDKSDYQRNIYKSLFKSEQANQLGYIVKKSNFWRNTYTYSLTLTINKSGAVYWSDKDPAVRGIIKRIFPFYSVDTRRLDLYDWSKLWGIVSELKFLSANKLNKDEHISYIDSKISPKSNSYKDYVQKISSITKTTPYEYQELIHNYIKVGLDGHTFNINGNKLDSQSDGTNSHKYLEMFLDLLIALTRREYIQPTIFVDEPEIGLHPKRNEELIQHLFNTYDSYKSRTNDIELGKYKTPNPTIIFSTHSPNIVKMVIKLFSSGGEHKIIQLVKNNHSTVAKEISSHYRDKRFLNVFSDNEARLFFSEYILFVEGETELEIFGNLALNNKFKCLRNIDVYRTNEVMLKAINPTNSKLSIPYLILYDADKMISINSNNGAITFLTKEVNLLEERDKFKFSIWGTEDYKLKRSLLGMLGQDGKEKDLVESKASFKHFRYYNFIKRINKVTVAKSKKYITSTTIEGSFINDKSIGIFFLWIISEFKNNTYVGGKGDAAQRLDGLSRAFKKSGNVKTAYLGIFAQPVYEGTLSASQTLFSKKIKIKYIRTIIKEIRDKEYSIEYLITIFRLLFEGKTDTLVSCSNSAYPKLSKELRGDVELFKDVYMKNFPCKLSKTGGWVTSFLNFSLEYMEKGEKNDSSYKFISQFRYYFPEINGIIDHVSKSIE
ncbi:retron Eco8 family effector endonuclease [Shewanella abyssi]|uniref:retron Eco8 family effector endonuclease n=1 Tax=Shewanella abyssi TaxID=311789 RepID=UPI00200E163F|nr:retron Eco8 family effector endonuclease [Shewanella abyssi]